MSSKIRQFAFPNYEKLLDEKDEGGITLDEMNSAILADLAPLIEYHWRAAQLKRHTDPEAEILKKMSVTQQLPSFWCLAVRGGQYVPHHLTYAFRYEEFAFHSGSGKQMSPSVCQQYSLPTEFFELFFFLKRSPYRRVKIRIHGTLLSERGR